MSEAVAAYLCNAAAENSTSISFYYIQLGQRSIEQEIGTDAIIIYQDAAYPLDRTVWSVTALLTL